MAGFTNKSVFGIASNAVKRLSSLGMEYEDMVVRQSRAVGITEAEFGNQGYVSQDMMYSLAMADIGQKKFIAFFDKEYKTRRDNLRKFALNSEIEFILDVIADEAIVSDDANFFCQPNIEKILPLLSEDKKAEISEEISAQFKRIYSIFNFNNGNDAWHYFRQLLIDGFLAFEIIYDNAGKNIIGFKELDATSLRPGVEQDHNGTYKKYWAQYEENPQMKRTLPDSSVIYISYARGNFSSRTSYVERLVRALNLLRLMENSRIIWNIMNSSFRLKMVVPISTKSTQKAKESLSEMRNIYKEDISLNYDSGELAVNGQPNMQFFKNYIIPSKGGEAPEISVIGGEGYDMSDTDIIGYFKNKLKEESKVPNSRFDKENNGGTYSVSSDGMDREEIRFFKFITRLRSVFQEILIKPLYIQICLKYEELQSDELFKSAVGIKYNKDNAFEELKTIDIQQKRIDFISSMMQVMTNTKDADGMDVEKAYFNAEFLVQKYMGLTIDDIQQNKDMNAAKEIADLEYMKKQKDLLGDDGM